MNCYARFEECLITDAYFYMQKNWQNGTGEQLTDRCFSPPVPGRNQKAESGHRLSTHQAMPGAPKSSLSAPQDLTPGQPMVHGLQGGTQLQARGRLCWGLLGERASGRERGLLPGTHSSRTSTTSALLEKTSWRRIMLGC